jgi:hypothetical protein
MRNDGTAQVPNPERKDKMRSLLAVMLSFTLLASTTLAQTGKQNSQGNRPPASPVSRLALRAPSALYECDGDNQCGNPRSGGAVWLFAGNEGQGMWRYNAVTKLTVIKFDGRNIHIRRADPAGTYSSAYVAGQGEFIGDYFGTITGSRIEGIVYLGGNLQSPSYPWHATIVNEAFCTGLTEPCPLTSAQLSILGRRASEAKMYAAAFRCFEMAGEAGDADGMGFEATMMMNGWGGKRPASQIMALLQQSADHDSYPGEEGLARAYAEGEIVAKNPARAKYWDDRANSRQARLEEQESSQANAQLAGKVLGAVVVFGILAALMSGGGESSGGFSEAPHDFQGENDRGYWYGHGGSNGGPPPGWHAGDPVK